MDSETQYKYDALKAIAISREYSDRLEHRIERDSIDTEARTLCKVRHTLDSQVKQVEQKLDLTPASEIKRVARRVARLQD